jgi:glycine cleavage system regulatory protein
LQSGGGSALAASSGNGAKTVSVVLTALARDRPGVVERLAEVVAGYSGNWVDSSMARLGGEFAGIVKVDVPAKAVSGLESAVAGLAAEGIDVTVHRDTESAPVGGHHARLALTGLDHAGIILEVTRTLARHGVSIDELNTTVSRGSMGAEPMFSASADVILPDDLGIDDLRDALELIAHDIMVDIDLTEA